MLNQSEPNLILTAHATKLNRTANVFGRSKSRLKGYSTVVIAANFTQNIVKFS